MSGWKSIRRLGHVLAPAVTRLSPRRGPRGARAVAQCSALAVVIVMLTVCTPGLGVGAVAAATGGHHHARSCEGQWVSGYTCTFHAEFNGRTLDAGKWTIGETSKIGFRSGPPGYESCYTDRRSNVSVRGGYLHLTARQEVAPFTCADPIHGDFTTQYTTGEVYTSPQFSQTYGRFEVRAKLPNVTVPGVQETFWLWPVDSTKYGGWPGVGEIDFGEFYSVANQLDLPYIHYLYDSSDPATNTNIVTAHDCTIDITKFNTYAVEWIPGRISLFYNGTTCVVDNYAPSNVSSPAPFDQPFFVALTQALGVATNAFDPETTPLPATTLVDYVRVWQRDDACAHSNVAASSQDATAHSCE